jgi:hypothetical protein
MSNCTPCTPANDELPIFCDPYPATDTAKRLLVEDEAFCQKALTSPTAKSWLIWDNTDNRIEWEPYAITFVNKTGDTMTGPLILSGNPTTALGAATKQYVDSADALKVSKAGDTMTGLLVLSADPSAALGAATKQYADLKVAKAGDTMTGALVVNSTIASNSTILANGNSSKIGYNTGAGGSITQGAGSKANSVTLNRPTGIIIVDDATLNANTAVTFNLSNTVIEATDIVVVSHISGGTLGSYNFAVAPAAGNANITIRNITAGNLSEALTLRFIVLKSVNA